MINSISNPHYFNVILVHHENEQAYFSAVEFSNKNNNLELLNTYESNDLEELVKLIRKNTVLLLVVTGKGVISKKSDIYSVSNSLINFNKDDFYSYSFEEDTAIFTSVSRKSFIDDVVSRFQSYGYFVLDIAIGPFVVGVLSTLIKKDIVINTGNAFFEFVNNSLIDFDEKPKSNGNSIEIDDEVIKPEFIIHYAGILNYLYPNEKISFINESLQTKREEYIYKNLFNKTGVFILAFFLGSLFLSYLILDYYNTKNLDIQRQLTVMDESYNKILSLEKNIKNKESILLKSGAFVNNFHSYYIDRMMRSLPRDLRIESLNFAPSLDKIKQEKIIVFNENIIEITGQTYANTSFNKWLNVLREMKWTEKVILKTYRKNKTKGDFFKIVIKVKTDV